MKINLHTDPMILSYYEKEWRQIAEEQGATIFGYPEWIATWWSTFGKGKRLFFYTVEENARLSAIWFFCLQKLSCKELFSNIAEPVSGYLADYHQPIIRPGDEKYIKPLISRLLKDFGRKVIIRFPHIPVDHPVLLFLKEDLSSKNYHWTEKPSICPKLRLADNYEATEKTWKKSLQIDVRRQRRRLDEKGKVELHIAESKEAILSALPDFFRMYELQWSVAGYNMTYNNPQMREFYVRLTEAMADNRIHFSYLKCGSAVISYHFGFMSNGWLFYYKPTYNLKYEKQSPSKVHLSYLIEHGLNSRWKGIDFLQGDESYKLQWTANYTSTSSITAIGDPSCVSYRWLDYWKPLLIQRYGAAYRKIRRFYAG